MKKYGKGFSLIEVMVALVILVVGLIGIFNLHTVAKQSSFESFQQTQAAYYINDIVSRMRLNKGVLISYRGIFNGGTAAPTKACVGAAAQCTHTETVAWDLYQWRLMFSGGAEKSGTTNVGGLDTPEACIYVNGSDVQVVMTWRGIRETSDATKSGAINAFCEFSKTGNNRRVFLINTIII
ncbi:type IV pilus modification protein PilV [Shewanella sp. JM162201]|uniref:Type IV pilus modification protein PilV n=1 Tax=Shewanella jiangmenensis TaxID=2837387 RepID=A0ABS5UZB5_9GAMM|nr:type IV pilus modification protein PilV [Shewanella jiangmenensis]MBT1443517.1 type IV pilus modification protein PilV [Shewanella jiangmenensis]